ncbi:hypothetical protein L3Q67_45315 (plasmid) [Saccharothrix sp. AJ9571]|nr:hypothetical protein L3Q67_45315 [Saccharothrix sp. AJ9571]
MTWETEMMIMVVARSVCDVVRAAIHRHTMRARARLLTAAAVLPAGIALAERAADGSTWQATTASGGRSGA